MEADRARSPGSQNTDYVWTRSYHLTRVVCTSQGGKVALFYQEHYVPQRGLPGRALDQAERPWVGAQEVLALGLPPTLSLWRTSTTSWPGWAQELESHIPQAVE